jgi:transglutaminase-like putative cysteine protease
MRIRMTIMAGLATLAGTAGLHPLFARGTWFWSGLGAVLAVAAGGVLMRRLRAPAIVSTLGGLALLHFYLTAHFAAGEAWLGFVPTPSSLGRLGDLYGDGWDAANRYAAPVPLVPGIALLSATGIGLVAAAVDLLAVRLRRAAPAGLPLLAMYSVPAAVRDESIGWFAFGIGAMGFLALLVADSRERVGGWGRVVLGRRSSEYVPPAGSGAGGRGAGGGRYQRPDSSSLAASGRRIGFASVALAVLIPTAVPGIHPRGMFGLGGPGGGGGHQTVTTPDPLVSLKRELNQIDSSVVLTYRSSDKTPDYLRLYALDRFDGDRWTYSPLQSTARDRISSRSLPGPPGLNPSASSRVTTKVEVRRQVRNMTFLPVPYAPSRLSIDGDWRVHAPSLMIYSLRDAAGGRSYEVTSLKAQPTPEQLTNGITYPSEIVTPYTVVPRNVPAQIRQLAQDVTTGSTTAHGQAVRLQKWFTQDGGFQYDLSAPAPQHGNDLTGFLLHTKRGYCEQYAAAMALMARILGIPARVAMGYTPGTQTTSGEWVVRSRDAHAWPELYFPGTGWVRFEPTPAGAAGQGTATMPSYTDPVTIGEGLEPGDSAAPNADESPAEEPSAGPSQAPAQRPQDQGPLGAAPDLEEENDWWAPLRGWLAGLLLVTMLLAAPVTVRALARRRRWAAAVPRVKRFALDPGGPEGDLRDQGDVVHRSGPEGAHNPRDAAHAAWREMRADAIDHGLAWRPSDTPRATARRLGELLELDAESSGALGRIARAEELARYSRSEPELAAEALRTDVRTVREAFAAGVSRRARLQARYLPPTGLAAFRSAGTRAVEAAGRLDRAGGRLDDLRRRLSARIRDRR